MTLPQTLVDTLNRLAAADLDTAELGDCVDALAQRVRDDIPSCVEVAVMIVREGGHDVARSAAAGTASGISYAGSLLLASAGTPSNSLLLLRASKSDAFDALADELAVLASQDRMRTPVRNHHRQAREPAPADLFDFPLSDVSLRNQAVGTLLDRGWLPEEAAAELSRLAGALDVSLDTAARLVLGQVVDRRPH